MLAMDIGSPSLLTGEKQQADRSIILVEVEEVSSGKINCTLYKPY
jgi:hypothetical protein